MQKAQSCSLHPLLAAVRALLNVLGANEVLTNKTSNR